MSTLKVRPFSGVHCETTATGTLLRQHGIELSEAMLFGLGEGLSYIFWNMKSMPQPFIGGRIKPDALTQNIAKNLNLALTVKETASKEKAWQGVRELIDQGEVVGLKLDCFYLEYFGRPFHFAGHYAALYGYDDTTAYLVDTQQQGGKVKTSLASLEKARAEKGPMSSKNLYYTIHPKAKRPDLATAAKAAIQRNAKEYLNPPITNISYRGIAKTATEIEKWFKRSKNIKSEFSDTAMMMEKAGTGGAIFRNLYRDFLAECSTLIQSEKLAAAAKAFKDIARQWTEVAALFDKVAATKDVRFIHEAQKVLFSLSEQEKAAMALLLRV